MQAISESGMRTSASCSARGLDADEIDWNSRTIIG